MRAIVLTEADKREVKHPLEAHGGKSSLPRLRVGFPADLVSPRERSHVTMSC